MEYKKEKSDGIKFSFIQFSVCDGSCGLSAANLLSQDDQESKAMCAEHYVCMSCRLSAFYKKSDIVCICKKTLYDEITVEILENKLNEYCLKCFQKLDSSKNPENQFELKKYCQRCNTIFK